MTLSYLGLLSNLRSRLCVWDESAAIHVWNKRRRNFETVLTLPVFENGTDGSLSGTQGGVKAVHIFLFTVAHLLDTASDFQTAGLVVSAVGARDKFLEFTLEWEPGF